MQTCEHHRAALYDSSSLDSACDEEQDTREHFLNDKKCADSVCFTLT